MKTQSCKSKGRRLQQKVANDILAAFPHLKADDCVSTSMGAPGEDIRLSQSARLSVPFSIECKNVERINIWSCLEQCLANSKEHTPCLVFSKNRSDVYACIPWSTFLQLLVPSNSSLSPQIIHLVEQLRDAVLESSSTKDLP